jgi:arsenate reductase
MLRIYTYQKCDTCRKALKFLAARGVAADVIPIREQPPSKAELEQMLELVGGDVRKLFNTSGQDYKALKVKDRLPHMTDAQALDLLARNGNLVKRPFVVMGKRGMVGFKEEDWRNRFPA